MSAVHAGDLIAGRYRPGGQDRGAANPRRLVEDLRLSLTSVALATLAGPNPVTVQYKPFTSTDQGTEKPKVEQVRVLVNGGDQPPDRCESAKTLATAAARRLPA